jgi:hypothetical protein
MRARTTRLSSMRRKSESPVVTGSTSGTAPSTTAVATRLQNHPAEYSPIIASSIARKAMLEREKAANATIDVTAVPFTPKCPLS